MIRFYLAGSFDRMFDRIFLNPDTGAGGGGVAAAPAAPAGGGSGSSAGVAPGVSGSGGGVTAPAATPAPSPAQPGAAASAPAGGGTPGFNASDSPASNPHLQAAGQPGGAQQQPWTAPSQQEWAQQQAQLNHFTQQFQQMQPLLQMGWQAWQQRQQGGANPPAGAQAPTGQPAQQWNNPFGLPQFDALMFNFVRKDPNTGEIVPALGAPPDAVQKYTEYSNKLREVQHEFWQNPGKFLQPMIQEQAQKVAQQIVQQQFGQHQQAAQVNDIVAQNRDWLYNRNADGSVKMSLNFITGQQTPEYTAAGRFYVGKVEEATRFGVVDPRAQHQYALAQLQAAVAQQQLAQHNAGAAGQQQQQQFLQQAAAQRGQQQPAAGAFVPPQAVPTQPAPTAQTLEQMLSAEFQAGGLFNPGVLEQQLMRPTMAV